MAATVIKIKRSQLAAAPGAGVLQEGELAYSQDRSGTGALAKLFISSKNAAGVDVLHEVGGKYFTDLLNAATDLASPNTIVKRDATGSASFVELNVQNLNITGTTTVTGETSYAADVVFEGDIAVNGGDITTTASAASLFNTGAMSLAIGGDATTVMLGSATGTVTIGSLSATGSASVGSLSSTGAISGDSLAIAGATNLHLTTVKSDVTLAAGSPTVNVFSVVDSADAPLFQVRQNGDAVIGGVLTVSGEGMSTFAGDVSIGGSITVAESATVTADFTANTATITGDFAVNGNTTLGDAPSDTTTINGSTLANGLVTIDSGKTFASATGADAFRIKSSDDQTLFQVKDNGDTVIGGVLTVSGTGTSTFAGDVSIGGSITVAENATVTADFTANTATITGDLMVKGNTTLGDAPTDTLTVSGDMSAAGNATFGGDVTISGNLVVNGSTTTVNSTTTTLTDPVLSLAKDTASADSFDRGIDFKWHNGTDVKTGFFGWDDSAEKFTFIKDATVATGEYSGVVADVVVAGLEASATILAKGGVDGLNGTTKTVLANFIIEDSVIDGGSF